MSEIHSDCRAFVLVGAGPTGVELAASMAQLAAVTLRGQYRRIDPASSSIILVEDGKRILPTFGESLARKAARRLEELGVKIRTGVTVEKVDDSGVDANGEEYRAPRCCGPQMLRHRPS
jgi:NADH:quinone reductase (non-electrogenic)